MRMPSNEPRSSRTRDVVAMAAATALVAAGLILGARSRRVRRVQLAAAGLFVPRALRRARAREADIALADRYERYAG
jgi:predicted RNA-binding Zn ribbon-like protein